MNQSSLDTLYLLCQMTRKIPLHIFAERVGYHKTTIRYHLRELETLGLIHKVSCGFWRPTFPGPYDLATVQEWWVIHRAASVASEVPWIQERILSIRTDLTRDPD